MQARCFACTRATRHLYVSDREEPLHHGERDSVQLVQGPTGWRAASTPRGRVVPRFSDWEFRPTAHGRAGPDWPVGYADLAPFYASVERFLGVHRSIEGLPQRPDGEYIAARPLSAAECQVRDAITERWPTQRFSPAPVVQYRRDSLPLPLRAALATGNLTLRSDTIATRSLRIVTAGHTRSRRSIGTAGSSEEIRGRVVVLCASAVETVRLLLELDQRAISRRARELIGDGPALMDHCMTGISGDVPESWRRGAAAGEEPCPIPSTVRPRTCTCRDSGI